MEQNLGGSGSRAGGDGLGSEDASEAREHVRNAEENRDALEAQNRRTEATTPSHLQSDGPVGGTGGMSAGGAGQDQGSEDASRAREHVHEAEENRDALEAQNRRVEETAPESTREDLRDR
ncbi:MAG TPA: hypothetical protein VF746_01305 [Longimicrobium sp.]|jgi:hypothetical protein